MNMLQRFPVLRTYQLNSIADATVGVTVFAVDAGVGAVPSPFDCYMTNRGMKTLHLRMERHAQVQHSLGSDYFTDFVSVRTACAKRTGAAASVERRRREPVRAISP